MVVFTVKTVYKQTPPTISPGGVLHFLVLVFLKFFVLCRVRTIYSDKFINKVNS